MIVTKIVKGIESIYESVNINKSIVIVSASNIEELETLLIEKNYPCTKDINKFHQNRVLLTTLPSLELVLELVDFEDITAIFITSLDQTNVIDHISDKIRFFFMIQ